MVKATTDGFDYNFFKKVTVDTATFPEDCQVFINIRANVMSFSLINEGSDVVEYSFNGNTLHGDLTPSTFSESLVFENRPISKIFFRAPSGGSPVVRVEAWGKR